VSAGLVVALGLLQTAPAARFALDGHYVPLPLAVQATAFWIILGTMTAADALAVRWEPRPRRYVYGAVLGVLVSVVMGVLFWRGTFPLVTRVVSARDFPPETMGSSIVLGLIVSVLAVGVWALAVVFPRTLERERLQSLQLANLELEAAELRAQGELARLRGQLEPHFLLNTLNLIAGLVGRDVPKARRTLASLGALLRDTLEEHGESQTVAAEIEWLERYCEILQTRHGPSLAITWDVAPEATRRRMPRLLLQPLVENAVVHGRLRDEGCARVAIRVGLGEDGALLCTVEDDGTVARKTVGTGLGIENVRRRLGIRHPGSSFELRTTDVGTVARVVIPPEVEREDG